MNCDNCIAKHEALECVVALEHEAELYHRILNELEDGTAIMSQPLQLAIEEMLAVAEMEIEELKRVFKTED